MVVRSNRAFDAAMIAFLGLLVGTAFRWSANSHIYDKRCSGKSAAFCELIKEFRGHAIFGLNPILLIFATFMSIFMVYCARRLWTGWSAKQVDDQILIPGFFGIKRLHVVDLVSVDIAPNLFGAVAHLNLTTKDGRRFSAANAVVEDAEEFARSMKVNPPLPPATPPAT